MRIIAKILLHFAIIVSPLSIAEGLDDYREYSKSDVEDISRSGRYSYDHGWVHFDRFAIGEERDMRAPHIFLDLRSVNHGDDFQSFSSLLQTRRRQSEADWLASAESSIKAGNLIFFAKEAQITAAEIIEDTYTLLVFFDVVEQDDSLTTQIGIQVWSKDGTERCQAIARVHRSALLKYKTSVLESLGQLNDYCAHTLDN